MNSVIRKGVFSLAALSALLLLAAAPVAAQVESARVGIEGMT